MDRSKKIIRTSFVGIAGNVVLVIFKLIVGLLTNSIAILLDAVNNFSDALSSVITIIGTKLSAKRPDKKHPYGYGRIEYLTAVLIAVLVLVAGLTSLRESADKIFHPEDTAYTIPSLIIIAAAAVAKFLMGTYVKKVGKELQSGALIASGTDAFFDSILSVGTLLIAIVSLFWHISLEGILGVVISVIIIKAGIELLLETLNSLIGQRVDLEVSQQVKAHIRTIEGVRGAYDLTLHDYGPNRMIGSVHVEVPDSMTAKEIHHLSRKIMAEVSKKFGIVLSVGIYATNDSEAVFVEMRKQVEEVLKGYPEILQLHGFYMDTEELFVMFDLVINFKADPAATREKILADLAKIRPEYHFDIAFDTDYSD